MDRAENFLTDYQKIIDIAANSTLQPTNISDPRAALIATQTFLETSSQKWLLILDNADDIRLFQQPSIDDLRLRDYLPKTGRTLITTRNSRLVGEISSAKDGIPVRSMEPKEAKKLLLNSIPQELSSSDNADEQASELVEELGCLPLAIAQASANIRHLRISLTAYANSYAERKSRMELLETAVNDSDLPPQSVLVTWQVSFDHVQNSDPMAAQLLESCSQFYQTA